LYHVVMEAVIFIALMWLVWIFFLNDELLVVLGLRAALFVCVAMEGGSHHDIV
jgi:hypothetical protein